MEITDSIRAPEPGRRQDRQSAGRMPARADHPVPTALPGDALRVLCEHVRDHPRIDVAVFVVVDPDRGTVEPAAAWFASPFVERAVAGHLRRPFDPDTPGLVETVLDRAQPLFLMRIDSWEAAGLLRAQVEREADEGCAGKVWDAVRQASLITCPVRAPLGRTVGLLVTASLDPARPLEHRDVATVSAYADLAALARERVGLAAAEERHKRREALLKRAGEDAARSLEIPEVERQVVEHALELVGAGRVVFSRSPDHRHAAAVGTAEWQPSPADLAAVARSRVWQVEGDTVHVPVTLGPRLFGVLSAFRGPGEPFDDEEADLLGRLARTSAAAIANAVDFDRERRIARALTRGFVPDSLPQVPGWEIGLLYEPAARQPAGGDVYGAWKLPGGGLAVLIGDVAGKGVETAALSAMARFFIEARSWHSESPAETLRQANTLLHDRLPSDTFVTAFLGLLTPAGLRYANAGHVPPLVMRPDGVGEAGGRGMPLGIEAGTVYEDHSLPLGARDALLAYTDGLVETRRSGEMFGDARLRAAAAEAADGGMEELVAAVHSAAKGFSGGLQDDAVVLALRRR